MKVLDQFILHSISVLSIKNITMLGVLRNRVAGYDATGAAKDNGMQKGVLEGNLPASWYTEPLFYEFERRAIFSRHWLLTTHRLRLPEVGSYLRFQIAGYDFFLIKNKEDTIQAFHNVCRHRAYPILDKDAPSEGKKSILSCGYHGRLHLKASIYYILTCILGWSYSINGDLAKAPKFDDLEGFDRKDYSLFKIHTHVDKIGFVWVNLDSSDKPIPWENMNGGTDEQPRLADFALDNYVYHRTWKTNGKYNWKVVGENYNEVSSVDHNHPSILTRTSAITAKRVIQALQR